MSDALDSAIEYEPIGSRHRPWVVCTLLSSVRETPCLGRELQLIEDALTRALDSKMTKTVIASPSGHPDVFLGYAIALGDALLFAYVRYANRRGRLGHRFGSDLIGRVIDGRTSAHIPVILWTRAASRMAANGYPIRFDLDEYEKFTNWTRRHDENS
jgi:hypothetical protein